MGFLDNTSITVDAVLTKKGREKLARDGNFVVSHYAFADDDIDYRLYDTAHPNGSSYYGAVLENMPVLEAFTDETQVMRYKLFTEDKDLPKLATVSVPGRTANQTISIKFGEAGVTLTPNTDTFDDDTFNFTLLNIDVATMTDESGGVGSRVREGRSQVIRGKKEVIITATDTTQQTIKKTVVFIASQNRGASIAFIIDNKTGT